MGDCDVAPDQDYNALIQDRALIFLILIPFLYSYRADYIAVNTLNMSGMFIVM